MSTDDLWQEADTLPPLFEEKKALLDELLKRAIGGLLRESRQRNILIAPYGRPEQPTPLLSLEQFLKNGGLTEPTDGSVNDEPIFSYEYGFDPLKYLASYLTFLHPNNIKQMRNVRGQACDFLRTRAVHAQFQMNCLYELQHLTERLRSGILWGPLIAPSTLPSSASGTLICACKAVTVGDLVVEVATEPSFAVVERSWRHKVEDESHIQKLILSNLEPSQTYFLRCYLLRDAEHDGYSSVVGSSSSSSHGGANMTTAASPAEEVVEAGSTPDGVSMEAGEGDASEECVRVAKPVVSRFYQNCQFTTSPSDEDRPAKAFTVVAVNARSAHVVSTVTAAAGEGGVADMPSGGGHAVSCFLGELFPIRPKPSSTVAAASSAGTKWFQKMIFLLHRYARAFSAPDAILRSTSMLLAWHDRTADSDVRLGEEEAAVKRFLSDFGKYQKKYGKGAHKSSTAAAKNKRAGGAGVDAVPSAPKLERPALDASMEALLQALPLEVDGQAAAKSCDGRPATATVRQLYYTQMLGPKVQLIVLDYRRGYLGKEQTSWLSDTLKHSPATWKLVLSGAPFGVAMCTAAVDKSAASESIVAEDEVATETKAPAGDIERAEAVGAESSWQLDAAPMFMDQPTNGPEHATEGTSLGSAAGGPTVKMSLPPPIEAAGWDEAGRLKLSLQSVIAELQKAAMKEKREKLRFQSETEPKKVDGGGSTSGEPAAVARGPAGSDGSSVDSEECDGRLLVESGIVIMSSGACVPEDRAKVVLAKSRMLPLVAEAPHFAAVYDPCQSGTAFCMELCIGGGEGFIAADLTLTPADDSDSANTADERSHCSQSSPVVTASHTPRSIDDGSATGATKKRSQQREALHPVVSASLGVRVLFGLQPAGVDLPPPACASLASLASDGASLDVKIVAVSPDGTVQSCLFACTLRCDTSFAPQVESD